jgi:phosphomannomutase
MAGIFKAYDIRGYLRRIPDGRIAFKIGRAISRSSAAARSSSAATCARIQAAFDALARGLVLHGAEVVDLGMCSTPMSY